MTNTKTQPETGCWIDGHWGHYGITRLIEIAGEYGFPRSQHDKVAIAAYVNDGEMEDEVIAIADDAEWWLNDQVAPDGWAFGWHDGEFFLWPIEDF